METATLETERYKETNSGLFKILFNSLEYRMTAPYPSKEQLPHELIEQLENTYSAKKLHYIIKMLSPSNLLVIYHHPDTEPNDYLIHARVSGMSEQELHSYNQYNTNLRDYNTCQIRWLKTERYLLGQRLKHKPNDNELADDMKAEHVPDHFRAFYVEKYKDDDTRVWKAEETVNNHTGRNSFCFSGE